MKATACVASPCRTQRVCRVVFVFRLLRDVHECLIDADALCMFCVCGFVGMDPNWRLIIPPGHEQVISEGHCIDECTQRALPAAGISIFAVLMQTYNIGSAIRLRQVS